MKMLRKFMKKTSPEAHLQSKAAALNGTDAAVLNGTDTAALDEVFPTAAVNVAVPPLRPLREKARPCNSRHGVSPVCGEDGDDLGGDGLGDSSGTLTTSLALPPLASCSGADSGRTDGWRRAASAGRRSTLLRRYVVPSTPTR
ncbi:hypothetical protein NQZ68_028389 [Dissostichus eleginoides]|nr:hypothetical protein NQZ68_028389 [Dissostichus eleginoides]